MAYVLYINESYVETGAYDPGSRECLALTQDRDDVVVHNVATLLTDGVELPLWLDATPCVVDTTTSVAHKGSNAVAFCRKLPKAAAVAEEAPEEEEQFESSTKVGDADVQRIINLRKQQDDRISQTQASAAPPDPLPP